MTRLQEHYNDVVKPELVSAFGYGNPMEVPKVEKVVINMGVGEAAADSKKIDAAAAEMALIAGQKPVVIKSRKSVATFKLREGMPIGTSVTLRRERMWEFLDRLISISLPRVRDFRGVSPKGFDGRGNFSMGIQEHIIFQEIDYDKIAKIKGLNISIVTTAKTDEEARSLLTHIGMPFRKSGKR